MAQLQRVEGQIELKCHADKFFDVWANKVYLISTMSPDKISKVELHEGKWHEVGSITFWTYNFAEKGEESFVKIRTEDKNEEKRMVRFNIKDGLVMKKYYKTANTKIEAIPKGSEGCIVKLSMEYEKMNENAPQPTIYVDFLLGVSKDIGASLCKA